ncbi:hypothetical protein ACUOA8_52750, partial [Escherichia sp. SS-MK2]
MAAIEVTVFHDSKSMMSSFFLISEGISIPNSSAYSRNSFIVLLLKISSVPDSPIANLSLVKYPPVVNPESMIADKGFATGGYLTQDKLCT